MATAKSSGPSVNNEKSQIDKINKILGSRARPLPVDIVDATGITFTVDSEFPAAAAITDNFANPTTTSSMSMLMGYDGSTWDRLLVGAGTEAGALRVTLPTDGTGVVGLNAGTNAIGKLAANSGVDIGDVDVTSLPVGTAVMAASTPITLATDDTSFGAVGAASDVDGNIHAQLRYIGEAVDLNDSTLFQDNTPFSLSSSRVVVKGGVFQSGTPATLDDNDAGAILLNSTHGQMVELMASSAAIGTVSLSATDNAVLDNIQTAVEVIDNSIAVLGTATYTEASTSGTIIGAVRNDALATLANTDNEIAPLQVNEHGAVYVQAGGFTVNPSATTTRPADTTAYASGDLISNNTTAASCVAMDFSNTARVAAGSFTIRRARLHKNDQDITAANFRLHLFSADPYGTAPTGGDNAALELNDNSAGEYLGYFDYDMTGSPDIQASDIELAAAPAQGADISVKLASGTSVYGVLEARAAYTPASGEVFTVTLEVLQD